MQNLATQLMDYEMGVLKYDEMLELFGQLIASGIVWSLQGSYGRTAQRLIEEGYIDRQGNLLDTEGDE